MRLVNLPNILSTIRIIVALIAPYFMLEGDLWLQITAGVICFIAITTDWFDGWYARKYNQVTKLGKILDPIADKVLVLAAFSVFVYMDVLAIWWVIPIFFREIIVTAYRFFFLSRNIVVAAVKSGKIKTVMQMVTIGIMYGTFMIREYLKAVFAEYAFVIDGILITALIVTLYLTINSGIIFFKNNWRLIKRVHSIS